MQVTKLKECGFEESALGFSLSYNTSIERAKELLPKYAFGKSGETKFLESIFVWLDVTAPRFWWQEADTYRLTTKQSSSTMHTISKKLLTNDNFELPLLQSNLDELNNLILGMNDEDMKQTCFINLKNALPEGFLQRRIWVMNYRVLQNIYHQRKSHRLSQWKYFCNELLKQIDHPEFIAKEE
jgi:hypothetical protein